MPRGGTRLPPVVQDQIFALAIEYKRRNRGNSPSRSQLRREFMKKYCRSISWNTFQEKIERLIERGKFERAEDAQLIIPDSLWIRRKRAPNRNQQLKARRMRMHKTSRQ